MTAAASQIGRMIINLCKEEGIKVICLVRRNELVQLLQKDYNCQYVLNTNEDTFHRDMSKLSLQLKPMVCLECISGSITGVMLDYMGFGSTLILYGQLEVDSKAGNISTLKFIGKK